MEPVKVDLDDPGSSPPTDPRPRPPGTPAKVNPILRAVSAFCLAGSVALHVGAMFPDYLHNQGVPGPLVDQTDQAVLYAALAFAWAVSLGLVAWGPRSARYGAAAAIGLAATELGFRLADLGQVWRYGSGQAGLGLWLMSAAWVLGAAGAGFGLVLLRRTSSQSVGASEGSEAPQPQERPIRPGDDPAGRFAWRLAATVLGLLVAGAFLPAWDRYVAFDPASGLSNSVTAGNAFDAAWQIVLGNVVAAVALALIPALAVRLVDRWVGAAMAMGSLAVLATQLAAAVFQVDEPIPGISHGSGLVYAAKLTQWYTLDVIATLAVLALFLVWAGARAASARS
jgi:hypothetical protein